MQPWDLALAKDGMFAYRDDEREIDIGQVRQQSFGALQIVAVVCVDADDDVPAAVAASTLKRAGTI